MQERRSSTLWSDALKVDISGTKQKKGESKRYKKRS